MRESEECRLVWFLAWLVDPTVLWRDVDVATFIAAVGYVVFVRAEEQMIRPHARSVVAAVKNTKTVRNLTMMENPTETMSGNKSAAWWAGIKDAVSMRCVGAYPLPT